MASKKAVVKNGKGAGQDTMFAPFTRHSGITPSLATLTREPIRDLQVEQVNAPKGKRREFILTMLTHAGREGLTWGTIREALLEAFGSAPKKRSSLYVVLRGADFYKVTGAKGVVTYYLGKAPKKVKEKAKGK